MSEDNEREFCSDAEKDETLCDTCKYFEIYKMIPMCCGNEYKEKEDE